ncbi:sensor histidine kinase [Amycolatopsis sp. cmx-4-68]|uniref:sensor histidine kinase n=1 Tax=Amycolatopsis sp. cmx-4-68 TaxID=2790938 RepID=UPI00397A8FBC
MATERDIEDRLRPAFRRFVSGAHAAAAAGIVVLVALSPAVGNGTWPARLTAFACAAALFTAHLRGFGFGRARGRRFALVAQAGLGFLPALVLGPSWTVLSGFFAAGLLAAVRPVRAVSGAVLVCLAAGVLAARPWDATGSVRAGLVAALAATVVTLALHGLTTSARLATEGDVDRFEIERRVVAEERRRFSRDMHDVLGLSLSAITLKGEVVGKHFADRPEQAMAELADLLVMSRKALADVRAVAAGYREMSLPDECGAAAGVLRAAGIEPLMEQSAVELPSDVGAALATVLREGVTNVVRHSKASWCRCSLRTVGGAAVLQVVNDGVTAFAFAEPAGERGVGLRNLHYRVDALGGKLTACVQPDGTHRLTARIPLAPAPQRREECAG